MRRASTVWKLGLGAAGLVAASLVHAGLPEKKQKNPGRSEAACVTPPQVCTKEPVGSNARSECVHLFLKANGKREGHPVWEEAVSKERHRGDVTHEVTWSSSRRHGDVIWTSSNGRRLTVCDGD
ncbi:MAG TPA: hypothetical protein VGB59_06190 [Allosphingosinicella sp.]|jgi:hypothetical protein